jgi:hydroxymethylpyrimidine kinase/phosphomethylpyrimidine kinase
MRAGDAAGDAAQAAGAAGDDWTRAGVSVPWVLVVAGHDPTGGAGVDADREAIAARGLLARTVISARTQQDGRRVHAIGARNADSWLAEARAELERAPHPPAALKFGMLPDASAVRAAAQLVQLVRSRAAQAWVVLDPVLRSSGGDVLCADAAALARELLPLGLVWTPNLPEAAELCGLAESELARELGQRVRAARHLCAAGARAVVLKGGHGAEDPLQELLLERGGEPVWLARPRQRGAKLHGSGCRFASALAAELASGASLEPAAARAGAWLSSLLADSLLAEQAARSRARGGAAG